MHGKNSYASPSVLIDGPQLFVHFGKLGTACLTRGGEIVWKTELQYNHRHGPGGSPVVFDDLLIIACDGTDVQYVTALNKKTGEEVWKTPRDGKMAYSTPLLIEVNGQPQLVSTGASGRSATKYAAAKRSGGSGIRPAIPTCRDRCTGRVSSSSAQVTTSRGFMRFGLTGRVT